MKFKEMFCKHIFTEFKLFRNFELKFSKTF